MCVIPKCLLSRVVTVLDKEAALCMVGTNRVFKDIPTAYDDVKCVLFSRSAV